MSPPPYSVTHSRGRRESDFHLHVHSSSGQLTDARPVGNNLLRHCCSTTWNLTATTISALLSRPLKIIIITISGGTTAVKQVIVSIAMSSSFKRDLAITESSPYSYSLL